MMNVFEITIKDEQWTDESRALAAEALSKGCKPVVLEGATMFPFSANGIEKILNSHFDLLISLGLEISGKVGTRYLVLEDTMMDNLVDVNLPHAKYTGPDEVEVRRVYEEYFKWKKQLHDGTWIVRLAPVRFGMDSGGGLSWEDFLLFKETFSGYTILTKTEGEALLPNEDTI